MEIFHLLLDWKDTDPNQRNSWGSIPLQSVFSSVVRGHQAPLTKLLLKRGSAVKSKDMHGLTPLFNAIMWGTIDTVKLLLEKGADWNAVDRFRRTPLFYAMEYGNVKAANVLLALGAEADIRDYEGWTPLSVAAGHLYEWRPRHTKNAPALISLLLDRRADINTKDRADRTPLIWVTLNKWWIPQDSSRIMNVILAHKGVEINWQAKDGSTASSIAVKRKLSEAEEILRAHGAIDI